MFVQCTRYVLVAFKLRAKTDTHAHTLYINMIVYMYTYMLTIFVCLPAGATGAVGVTGSTGPRGPPGPENNDTLPPYSTYE